MDFEHGAGDVNNTKLEKMYENLANITKQLAILQGFITSKFGHEYTSFCQFSEAPSAVDPGYPSLVDTTSMHEDAEDYEKMPNLVSQESPSRTLGFVTVPLRQSSSTKIHSPGHISGSNGRRERSSTVKEENVLETGNDNDDMMYPLHNFSDLLDGTGEVDANETPEFLELELDPSTLLRGEPPALQPMFASNTHGQNQQQPCINNNNNNNNITSNNHSSKRSNSRQGGNNIHRYDIDTRNGGGSVPVTRRASVGSSENNVPYKKFDCHICGIKFEFSETLKSHLESHAGARNIRSNSEDQSALGNSPNALPLPKLMPRPLLPVTGSIEINEMTTISIPIKTSKASRKGNSQISSSSGSSSSLSSSKAIAALKRRKCYNQSRPCALKCPECNLPIRDKSRLIEHLRGHTGERPFECTVCEKAYTRRDVLKTHMLKMHGIIPLNNVYALTPD